MMCMHSVHRCANLPKIPNTYISKDLIINSFIITFNELKTHMYHEMQKVNAELINCDHTFKMASHVGVFRNG